MKYAMERRLRQGLMYRKSTIEYKSPRFKTDVYPFPLQKGDLDSLYIEQEGRRREDLDAR